MTVSVKICGIRTPARFVIHLPDHRRQAMPDPAWHAARPSPA
ncbi:MAG: hypothetical protein ACRYHQ_29115 [Janthinobacterium lividum]